MSLATLPKVQKLQDTLHAKAKGSPNFRFYALYDKIYRDDVLWVAHRRCLLNKGAAGVDGQTFEDIAAYGEKKWLAGTDRRLVACGRTQGDVEDLVAQLNRKLIGWSNYFCLGPVSKAYAAVDQHACKRLRQWLCTKHKVRGSGTARFPDQYPHEELGLIKLSVRTRNFPWATA